MSANNMAPKSKNTGVSFEKQLQDIYQQILASEGLDLQNVRVERRAKIDSKLVEKKGHPLKHEIDLYWEFRSSGILHKVCIQAKDDEVTLAMVLTFKGVLDDIPGQPRGAIVTSKRFQEGAYETAKAHGIELYQLRPPADGDGITKICINLIPTIIDTRSVKCEYGELPQTELQMSLKIGEFFDEYGNLCMTVPQVQQKCVPKGINEGIHTGEYTFEQPTFIHTGNQTLPRVQVKKIIFEFEFKKQPAVEYVLSVNQMLLSLTGAQSYFVDNKGIVRPKGVT